MNRRRQLIALLVPLALFSRIDRAAIADERGPIAPVAESSRGVAGSIDVRYEGGRLRAKTIDDLSAPMMVRVIDAGPDTYRVEFLGLVSGEYDLAEYLELDDGRTAAGLGELPVQVRTQLPPNYGTDIFGLGASELGLSAHYRTLIGVGIVLWLGVPVIALTRRVLRRSSHVEVFSPVIAATADEQLLWMITLAKSQELSHSEKGRLELLLLRVLREREGVDSFGDTNSPDHLARTIAELRRDPRTAALVTTVETWLHSNDGAPFADDALAALDADRARTQSTEETGSRVGAS